VALAYERTRMRAPVVVAKGRDRIALRIRAIARQSGVHILEDPPLARGLHDSTRIGQEIPQRFFQAVAAVLSHVYRLRAARPATPERESLES
jgi:flagellar biosynthetic protein FlhB